MIFGNGSSSIDIILIEPFNTKKMALAIEKLLREDDKITKLSKASRQNAIDNLMRNRTVLVIAHRLSTIKNADKIIVIDSGEIIESGTHDELYDNSGMYHRLYKIQFES